MPGKLSVAVWLEAGLATLNNLHNLMFAQIDGFGMQIDFVVGIGA